MATKQSEAYNFKCHSDDTKYLKNRVIQEKLDTFASLSMTKSKCEVNELRM
jgi:hypothetical protein